MAKHILIVDDELNITQLLEEFLASRKFTVTVAHTGETALSIAKACYPNLIILDLMLPGMQGEAVCQELKHSYDTRLRNIPVLILTGKTSDVDHVFGMALGASAYMEKPFEPSRLLQTIRLIL